MQQQLHHPPQGIMKIGARRAMKQHKKAPRELAIIRSLLFVNSEVERADDSMRRRVSSQIVYTPPQKSGQDFAPSQVKNVTMRRFY
jgi:hypothetical protein